MIVCVIDYPATKGVIIYKEWPCGMISMKWTTWITTGDCGRESIEELTLENLINWLGTTNQTSVSCILSLPIKM